MQTLKLWLRRLVAVALLGVLSLSSALFLLRDTAPGLWRDFRCLPSYLQQPSIPYATFLDWVKSGRIKTILFSSAQAQAYFTLPTGEYRVKLPELDTSWLDLLSEKKVQVIELVAESC